MAFIENPGVNIRRLTGAGRRQLRRRGERDPGRREHGLRRGG